MDSSAHVSSIRILYNENFLCFADKKEFKWEVSYCGSFYSPLLLHVSNVPISQVSCLETRRNLTIWKSLAYMA